MTQTVTAIFDGKVFHPSEPIALAANTRVQITIETVSSSEQEPVSFLKTARSLNLDGPTDWSANLDQYLYGQETQHEDGSVS